jgi:hypothetical protein
MCQGESLQYDAELTACNPNMCSAAATHTHIDVLTAQPDICLDVLLLCACSIQQSAALAIGRLANYSDDLAEAVVQNEILPQLVSLKLVWAWQYCSSTTCTWPVALQACVLKHLIIPEWASRSVMMSTNGAACSERINHLPFLVHSQVYSLAEQNRFYKKAAGYCLRAVAKHSPELAQAVIDSGALDSLVTCLEEFDPGVKEAATWCLGYIAGHNTELAQQVVDAGVWHAAARQAFSIECCSWHGVNSLHPLLKSDRFRLDMLLATCCFHAVGLVLQHEYVRALLLSKHMQNGMLLKTLPLSLVCLLQAPCRCWCCVCRSLSSA